MSTLVTVIQKEILITSTNSKLIKSFYKIMKHIQTDSAQIETAGRWTAVPLNCVTSSSAHLKVWGSFCAGILESSVSLRQLRKNIFKLDEKKKLSGFHFHQKQLHMGSLTEFSYCGISLTHWKQWLWCLGKAEWKSARQSLNEYSLLIIADEVQDVLFQLQ